MAEQDGWITRKVVAEICLLPTDLSGRSSGITSGYRPNHNFGGPENNMMRMGSIYVPGDEWIHPGTTKAAEVIFVFPKEHDIELIEGLEWRIQEGANLVGNGRVLKVLDA